MLILGIDTTEKNINLALADDKKILYEIEETSPKTEELINQIVTLFKKSKKESKELSAIGVITGPGGYTGTRSGVSVAKTISQFLQIPIVGINKLEALLFSYDHKLTTAPMINIKRNEAYTCLADFTNDQINYILKPKVMALESFIEFLKNQKVEIKVLAYEFEAKKDLFSELPDNIKIDFSFHLKPSHITKITADFINVGKTSTFLEVTPFYIREAI